MIIRICDDDQDSAETWVAEIASVVGDAHSVERLEHPVPAIEVLVDRKKAAQDTGSFDVVQPTQFDDFDILVVDYDLIHIDKGGNRTTGEGVARLAKAYSRCNLVVVLNQFSKVDFDLTMTGHLESWADVNIDARSVGEPSLWQAGGSDFAPSYWAPLLELADQRKAFAEKLAGQMDAPILAALELSTDDLTGISDQAFAFLSESAKALDQLGTVTSAEFIRQSLAKKDADALLASPPEFAARLVASRIAHWLDRSVWRPLDALIDAAHLIERRPYLTTATADQMLDLGWWASLRNGELGALREEVKAAALLGQVSRLVGKPVFSNARLEADALSTELANAYDYPPTADVVFAEDTSRFVERSAAKEFRAGFGNFNDRRFVEYLQGKDYGPVRRFAFGH